MIIEKACGSCSRVLPVSAFVRNKLGKFGLHSNCKCCQRAYREKHRELLDEYQIQYREINRVELAASARERSARKRDDPQEIAKRRKYYTDNRELILQKKVQYNIENRARISKYRAGYSRRRYSSDLKFKLSNRLRSRLLLAIRKGHKGGSAIKSLGCSFEEFILHIEAQFQDGMFWENWSRYGWHLDHIKPLSAFDLTDPEQVKLACHYTNLQPLWAKDNLRKSDKLDYASTELKLG